MSNPNDVSSRLNRLESSIRDQRDNLQERIRETSFLVGLRLIKLLVIELNSELSNGETITPEKIDNAVNKLKEDHYDRN
ncbi:MAG: hypothetical protein ACJARV_000082 [Candidatus Pseudothioglobus sp.]|mgnify:CR=1 FL=1|jgi:hypothetical protein|tara:strand:+ start:252 stop:488 length:237 start_codon:yes stop_codon:yes gene_type:complete